MRGQLMERDYKHCEVCGDEMSPDRLHIVIDNGRVMRHVYCCRRHRYVMVNPPKSVVPDLRENHRHVSVWTQVQERSDLEIESLAFAFRAGELQPGWE